MIVRVSRATVLARLINTDMNLLRSTHQETQFAQGFPVVLEVSHLKLTDINMLYSLIEIWLYQNCKSEWTLEQIEEIRAEDHSLHTYIRIVFKDVREALYYKLSPSYLHDRKILPLFLHYQIALQGRN